MPLDPDEAIVAEKRRRRRTYATLVPLTLVSVAILTAYLCWDRLSLLKPAVRKSVPQSTSDEQVNQVPQVLGWPAGLALPAPKPLEGGDRAGTPVKPAATEKAIPDELLRAKEMITQLTALISRKEFATAINRAGNFRDEYPNVPTLCGKEYRELLKLERTATEQYFKSQVSSGRRPSYETGDLDVAVIDHDLMTAYLQAAMPTFAREHFGNAEKGYGRALSIARQREQSAAGSSSARRAMQQITENLGLLYTSWAEYKPDVSILRKADAAFFDSERLLDYAEDPVSAKSRVEGGKASVERLRRKLP